MSMTAATGLILIIDDSVANIRLLTKLLEGQGSIIFATSGDDGMALAQRLRNTSNQLVKRLLDPGR